MSLEKDITSLKKIMEADNVFKAAGGDELTRRMGPIAAEKKAAIAEGKVWCNDCMKVPRALMVEFGIANQKVRLKDDGKSIASLGEVNVQEPNYIVCVDCYQGNLVNEKQIIDKLNDW